MTLDNDGRLVVCEHVTSSVVRDGSRRHGQRARGARHATTRGASSTAPTTSSSRATARSTSPTRPTGGCPGFGIEREQDLDFQGVYRIAPGGGDPQLLVDDFDQPNGLCFSPDESLLYINDTDARATSACSTSRPTARWRTAACWPRASAPATSKIGDLVDGMKLDERGNVWVTGPRRRVRVRPAGRAPRHRRGARERRQPQLGRRRTGTGCSSRRRPRCTASQCKVSGNRLPYMR